jgi:hypothetical protein
LHGSLENWKEKRMALCRMKGVFVGGGASIEQFGKSFGEFSEADSELAGKIFRLAEEVRGGSIVHWIKAITC